MFSNFFSNTPGAGWAPVGTPSCCCAGCGSSGVPLETLKQCEACKSMTCLYCSDTTCQANDASRHKSECEWKQRINQRAEKYRKNQETVDFCEQIQRFGSEDPNSPTGRLAARVDFSSAGKSIAEDVAVEQERANAEHLQLRILQLEHATQMYRQKNGLETVPAPPHNNCANPSCPNTTSASPDWSKLLRCTKCKMVRYCSKPCQRADWKKHKPWCRVPLKEEETGRDNA